MEQDLKNEDALEWSLRTLAEKQFPTTQAQVPKIETRNAIEFLKNLSFKKPIEPPSEDQKQKLLEEYEQELKKLFESNIEEHEKLGEEVTVENNLEKQAEKEFPLNSNLPPLSPDEVRRSMKLTYNEGLDPSPLANASDVLSKDDFRMLEALITQYRTENKH